MNSSEFTYSENVLQWIWKTLRFDTSSLTEDSGAAITVLDPGELNTSDGPDFKNAVIQIGDVIWHGSVEVHVGSRAWYSHGHHQDKNYNNVILHVVAEENYIRVRCKDGSKPPTLNLLPHLGTDLESLVRSMNQSSGLPCSNGLSYISEEALIKQIEKAQAEYLEKKSNDFLEFYDPAKPPFTAWKCALVLSIFDGFGISKNRRSMITLGERFLEIYPHAVQSKVASELYGMSETLKWNNKGVRPHNRPAKRINEAIRLAWEILELPEEQFLGGNFKDVWNTMLERSGVPKSGRCGILYGTVFITSMYVLGNLFRVKSMKRKAFIEWSDLSVPVPKEILERYTKISGLNPEVYSGKLGAVHQLRSYCNKRRCHECFVLKKVISS